MPSRRPNAELACQLHANDPIQKHPNTISTVEDLQLLYHRMQCSMTILYAYACIEERICPLTQPNHIVHPAVIVRQRKSWRRKDGVYLYFEDNAGVIVNPKGEMKGSAITGPVGKECADIWPKVFSILFAVHQSIMLISFFSFSTIVDCFFCRYRCVRKNISSTLQSKLIELNE